MMVAAAGAVAECALQAGSDGATPLLPPLVGMRDAAREIALAVAKAVVEDHVAPQATEAELRAAISAAQWTPRYASGAITDRRLALDWGEADRGHRRTSGSLTTSSPSWTTAA